MVDNNFNLLEQLELEERELSYEINRIEDEKKVVETIDERYQEIFHNLQYSFTELEHVLHNSRKVSTFSELFQDIKGEIYQINEHIYSEKLTMDKEYRILEEKEDALFYEKKKLLLEEK